MTLSVDTVDDRLVVTVSGELDLESDELLQRTLSDALADTDGGLELDLAGVDFCDCSALNVLLEVHHRARADAKHLVLRATSPAVRRLLDLTGTLPLFTAGLDGTPGPGEEPPSPSAAAGDASGDELAVENAQLHRALETRASIDLARGILMASYRLTAQQSWQVLVTASQHSNTKLHLLADAVLQTTDGRALAKPLADHLATAVRVHTGSAQGGF
ncbi:anti-sigma factor antagonist [Streptomyces sp. NPDC047072]|uniref:anti-sigma factor antagonist n=1 Tax=Streptomyces sp. NPDC047072 TaxID=3154809 RepID=UPI00340F1B8C